MFIVDEKLEKFKIANLLINNGNDTQISKFLFAAKTRGKKHPATPSSVQTYKHKESTRSIETVR